MVPMRQLDGSETIPVSSDADFDAWLREHGDTEQEVFIAIFKKSSGNRRSPSPPCRKSPFVMVGSTRSG
jgi:hypothetical protein